MIELSYLAKSYYLSSLNEEKVYIENPGDSWLPFWNYEFQDKCPNENEVRLEIRILWPNDQADLDLHVF